MSSFGTHLQLALWELGSDIVGGADQTVLSQGATKEGQLTETDRPRLALNPSSPNVQSARPLEDERYASHTRRERQQGARVERRR